MRERELWKAALSHYCKHRLELRRKQTHAQRERERLREKDTERLWWKYFFWIRNFFPFFFFSLSLSLVCFVLFWCTAESCGKILKSEVCRWLLLLKTKRNTFSIWMREQMEAERAMMKRYETVLKPFPKVERLLQYSALLIFILLQTLDTHTLSLFQLQFSMG